MEKQREISRIPILMIRCLNQIMEERERVSDSECKCVENSQQGGRERGRRGGGDEGVEGCTHYSKENDGRVGGRDDIIMERLHTNQCAT